MIFHFFLFWIKNLTLWKCWYESYFWNGVYTLGFHDEKTKSGLIYPSNTYKQVNTNMTVIISPNPRKMPFIWAMKMLATATNIAVPSMLILHPMGRTNLVTLGSTLNLSVISRKVTGSAAALCKPRLEKITNTPFIKLKRMRLPRTRCTQVQVILAFLILLFNFYKHFSTLYMKNFNNVSTLYTKLEIFEK